MHDNCIYNYIKTVHVFRSLIPEESKHVGDFRRFAKLRKATVSFVKSVRLSTWNNSAPTRRMFMNFDF